MIITYDEPGIRYNDTRYTYSGQLVDQSRWPIPSDVRLGVQYGPTGANYTGTLIAEGQSHTVRQAIRYNEPGVRYNDPRFMFSGYTPILWPHVADVRAGVAYGPNGSDYIGTLVVGEVEQPAEQPVRHGGGIFRWPNHRTAITPLDPDEDEIVIPEQLVAHVELHKVGTPHASTRRARSRRDLDILFLR